ncbi:MAG: TonB-dependent receptor [Lewinellaceae bacterium]|nr:TonB-dependent receptor [Phaeodactylibacter sp.]MCB9351159.1 TonB-dependent receptor [Lewinellaceae bacterium]
MKLFTRLLLIPLFLLGWGAAQAQATTYTGVVTEEGGEPLIGVNILNKKDATGTITDFDGRYELRANVGDTIVVSYTGYEPLTQVLGVATTLDFELRQSAELLEEIVVVGYGSQKSRDLTSSITTIRSDEIEKTPSGQPMQALQGKVAGLQIVSAGSPGEAPKVRVRGVGSYPGSDNEAPLYVVDGMFFDNIDFLNNNDIKSISVLKDASAAAIYGVRAANGVVLIETKGGKFDAPAQITYDGYYGVQAAQNVLKMANAEQFTTMALESGSEADISFINNAMQRYGRSRINPNVPDANTDWYDVILRNAAIMNHSVDVSGGGSKAAYSVGTSYFMQEGILDMKNEYERFNLRSKIDFKATDWLTIGGNAIISNGTRYLPEDAAWFLAYYAVPIMPVYDEKNTDATPLQLANAQDLGYRGGQNPLVATEFNENQQKIRKLLGNFYVQFNILPEKLSFKSAYNSSYTTINSRNLDFPYFIGNNFQRENSAIQKINSNYFNQIWDNILTYEDSYGKHNLTAMVGSSYRDEAYDQLEVRALNFPTDQEAAWFIDQAETLDTDRGNVGDDGSRYYGISYFGRVAYNFANRYLIYGTYRADGSNKYQEKWGYFPTVGVGWVLSEESFFDVSGINYLKLRASWGELGNDRIQASDGATTTSVVTTSLGDVQYSGTQTSNTFSALRWEVVEETNFGLTAEFLRSRLSVEADYYTRDTKNAAIRVNIPAIGGTVLRNVGVIRNSGFELALNWSNSTSSGINYSIGGNIATLKNEVISLFGQPYIDGGTAEFRQRSIVGEPLLAFYGWETAGVYQNQAEIDADPIAVANNLEPGDLKYVDQNGDGVNDAEDRVVLGSYLPSFMFGANLGISFKGFDLSANLYGQSGNKILNRRRGEVIFTNDTNLDADLANNRWHGEGTSNSYPSSKGIRKGWNQRLSDYWVDDGAFWRIQNVQLAYNIQGEKVFGPGAPDLRVSFTADRPLTVFDYVGFTAEIPDGVDRQTYPIPAVYTVGLNVKF